MEKREKGDTLMRSILTPISLWRDFRTEESLEPETVGEREADGLRYRQTYFLAQRTGKGRVRAFGTEVSPAGAKGGLPAMLLLCEAGSEPDLRLAERIARRGYLVFCLDYRGKTEGDGPCTEYPEDAGFANFLRAGRLLLHADDGARRTPWYEWTAAAAYAVKYLRSLPGVTEVGAMGIREGGDILWKLMAVTDLACGICVNAAGWLAYRGVTKFGQDTIVGMGEESRMFIAGLDSQSYAPYVRCPVLMLVATTDAYVDADRAYDTYVRINPKQFSTICFCNGCGGAVGPDAMRDADMFMDKYVKKRQVFLTRPLEITLEDGADGGLWASVQSDRVGEAVVSAVYYAEDGADVRHREWMKSTEGESLPDSVTRFPLSLYGGTDTVYAFARAMYSSGFCASSRITCKKLTKRYANSVGHSRLLYDSGMDGEFFVPADISAAVIGGCMQTGETELPRRTEGYGKIAGMSCPHGLRTYRVSQRRYAPEERSLLHVSLYSPEDSLVTVAVTHKNAAGQRDRYTAKVFVAGGGKWKNFVLAPKSFKDGDGTALKTFYGIRTLEFTDGASNAFVVNNILWV